MSACVVGGGIVGTLTAHALAGRGIETRILDAGLAGDASSASAGILFCISDWDRESDWTALARGGSQAYSDLCADMAPEAGFECRGLLVAGTEAGAVAQWAATQDLNPQILSAQNCRQRYRQLAAPTNDATLLSEVAQIDPRKFLSALQHVLQQIGVRREVAQIREVVQEEGVVRGVSDDTRMWPAEQVVWAAGAWSGEVPVEGAKNAVIEPRRGQVVVWRDVDVAGLPIVLEGPHYLVPRANGELLAGATNEAVGFDSAITQQAREELVAFARRWYPDLTAEPAMQYSGLRPRGDLKRPIVGPHPRIEGLYFNTGHYRHGVVCAPATAARVAAQVQARMSMAQNPL